MSSKQESEKWPRAVVDEKTEKTAAIGGSLNLYRLTRNTRPPMSRLSEVIKESSESLIHYHESQLDH